MSDLPKGKKAVQQHIQDLFYGYPITVVSMRDQLNLIGNVDLADYLTSESVRRDEQDGESQENR